jgi:hypothetical protein
LLWALAAILIVRGAAGALIEPPSAPALLLTGLLGLVLAWLSRSDALSRRAVRDPLFWAAAPALFLLALALSLPGGRTSIGLVWAMVVASEVVALRIARPKRRGATGEPFAEPPTRGAAADWESLESEPPEEELPDAVLQRFTRARSPEGLEMIRGQMRAEFAPGERTVSLHLSFCPPMTRTPELHFEQLSGPPARIKQGSLYAYAARLDLRLKNASEESSAVVVQIAAVETAGE